MATAKELCADYINATRLARPDKVSAKDCAGLQEILALAIGAIPGAAAALDADSLIVTFSLRRECEIVGISGRRFLVYDLGLREMLLMLNEVWLSRSYRIPLTCLAHKYLAERFLQRGFIREAVILGDTFLDLQGPMRKDLAATLDNNAPTIFTMIQEYYILSHEILHCILESDPALRRSKLENSMHFIRTRQTPAAMRSLLTSILGVDDLEEDLPTALETASFPAKGLDSEGVRRDLAKRLAALSETEMLEASELYSEDLAVPEEELEALALEMACDDIAAAQAINFSVQIGVPRLQAVRAILACQFHLRWLAEMGELVRGYIEQDFEPALSRSFRESRLRSLKAYSNSYLALHNGPRMDLTVGDDFCQEQVWEFDPTDLPRIFDAAVDRADRSYGVVVRMMRDRLQEMDETRLAETIARRPVRHRDTSLFEGVFLRSLEPFFLGAGVGARSRS